MKNIVVAEDFNVSRKIICSVLSKEGHTVMEAANGKEAASLFDGRNIDMLITDFNMPEMTGGELIQQVRANNKYAYMPILLLTTEVNEDKLKIALNENITAWIKKPFQTDEFLKIVKKALR
ncbi:response regulator [Marinigracilibium pacificum]|uniref:Response regulator n=1 Tax=Marinigracilibium pacificum TaxID=2729599 RepID=A0A848J2N1_9BACT|nr:response regulator [Marinigracilibium pacificum]NMM47432.1 response regulator [Marinigracilibium pacificum]